MAVARNIAIVALLALLLTVAPGGSNFATALITALSLIFFAAIGMLVARLWRETSFTRDVMTDRQRGIFYASLGALALMIAGLDEMFDSGPGTVAWIAIVGISAYLAVDTWRRANA